MKKGIQMLEQRNNQGKTAFLLAVEYDNTELFEWILETYGKKKINVFARDYDGNTAMHHAVMNKNMGIIETLYNIDPEQSLLKNHKGKSPFFLAVEI